MKKIDIGVVIGTIILFLAPIAQANKVEKVELIPPQFHHPQVQVYSTNGEKWTNIDKAKATTFKAEAISKCKYTGKVSGKSPVRGSLSVTGFKRVSGGTNSAARADVTGVYQYSGKANIDPIKVCNDELKKRLANSKNKTKYHFLAKGFNVKYDGAFGALYGLTCKATGLGFDEYKGASAYLNATIACGASALAEKKIPKKKAKTKLVPLIKSVQFAAKPKSHSGSCPVGVKFMGKIAATRSGKVKYQYVSNDGKKSPVFALAFSKAGTKNTGNWSRTINTKKPNKNDIATSGVANNTYKGWQRLDILSPKGPSRKASFSVTCKPKTPARATKIKIGG